MIIDLETYTGPNVVDCEVCVVGAGAVGLALATALARSGVHSVVLEGGGLSLDKRAQDLQRGESIGHPFANIGVGRYRVLGGTTTFWGGQVDPFDRFVTDARPWLGYAEWPVSRAEIDKWVERAFLHIGLSDVEPVDTEVWRKLNMQTPTVGEELNVVLSRWVRIRNFAKLYGRELRSAVNLQVFLRANVYALDLSESRTEVAGIHARSLEGRTLHVRAKDFVLANGTLEIVRTLLQPLRNGTRPPWKDSPWLGRPLIDHLDCVAGSVKILDHKRFHDLFDNIFVGGLKYYPKIRLSEDFQRSEEHVDIAAQFAYRTRLSEHFEYLKMFSRSIREGGAQVSWRALPQHAIATISMVMPLAMRYFRDRRSFKPFDAEVTLAFNCEQRPFENSRIELGDEVDAFGMRRLRVNWQIDGRELRTMHAFGMLLKRRLAEAMLAEITLDPKLEAEDPAFVAAIHDAVHQMGTTRMAVNPEEGFVDANARVHSTENLFIAGAAVFPSTGFANPTLTAIALALRLADYLSARVHDD